MTSLRRHHHITLLANTIVTKVEDPGRWRQPCCSTRIEVSANRFPKNQKAGHFHPSRGHAAVAPFRQDLARELIGDVMDNVGKTASLLLKEQSLEFERILEVCVDAG
jgi:hypothetical protein